MEVFTQSVFTGPVFVTYGKLIASNTYQPAGFKLSLGYKDSTLVSAAANHTLTPMPLGALMLARYQAAMAKGWKDLDWAAAALNVSQDAGLWKG
jgi:3-hydroxyisobutyrate dehydrogenase-like beta-hydroxyacid dehydrogenase